MMPNRFVAVNPYSRKLNALAAVYREKPMLAQFRFIQAMFEASQLIPTPVSDIRKRISRQLLNGATGTKGEGSTL